MYPNKSKSNSCQPFRLYAYLERVGLPLGLWLNLGGLEAELPHFFTLVILPYFIVKFAFATISVSLPSLGVRHKQGLYRALLLLLPLMDNSVHSSIGVLYAVCKLIFYLIYVGYGKTYFWALKGLEKALNMLNLVLPKVYEPCIMNTSFYPCYAWVKASLDGG